MRGGAYSTRSMTAARKITGYAYPGLDGMRLDAWDFVNLMVFEVVDDHYIVGYSLCNYDICITDVVILLFLTGAEIVWQSFSFM